MYICVLLVCLVPAEIREGIGSPGIRLTDGWSHHVLGFKPESLQEQLMLFAAEPSLAPTPGLASIVCEGTS